MAIKHSELWQRLRAARKRAGYTQSDIAAHFEIDRSAVTKWESRVPAQRVRPDIAKLEEFAALTSSPLWWILSDEVDVSEPWPFIGREATQALSSTPVTPPIVRQFWTEATLEARRLRQNLWDGHIWEQKAPVWMHPITPDAVTERCILQMVQVARVSVAHISMLATALLGFEKAQGREYDRKAILIWHPKGSNLSQAEKTYSQDVVRVEESAQLLTERLGVRYIEVRNKEEAAHYLVQLL